LGVHVKVEIWSDVVCPWCYVGKRRFGNAVAASGLEVEVTYRSFELDPNAPVGGGHLTIDWRDGGPARVAAMQARVRELGLAEGLDLRLGQTFYVNTVDAHRLLHLALATGGPDLQGRLNDALLDANLTQVLDLSDHATLLEIAASNGPDGAYAVSGAQSTEVFAQVLDQVASARSLS
jgi:predicted DsbA family dithiol-disulfide isomerase